MNLRGTLVLFWALASLHSAEAQWNPDTIWLCRDTTAEDLFLKMYLSDTFPDNRGMFAMVDTGDTFAGNYINFDYRFGHPHPGYAGFKIFWDYGVSSYWVSAYDSMMFWHKGPLPGHKVRMIWAQGSAGCGTPINYEYFGEFKPSPVWKRESFAFPSGFVKDGLFELRMLIFNDSGAGSVSDTSPPGNLKVDNLFFHKKTAGVGNAKVSPEARGTPRFFVPKASGMVTLTIFSVQGEQIFKEPVNVTAGKRYGVSRFARKYSNLPVTSIGCVHIVGAGVNIKAALRPPG
jgi:hypothetical protein